MKHHRSTRSCSRRHFLSGAGVTLAGFGLSSVFPTPLIQAATNETVAGELAPGKRMLFVFLRGGNDGLNAVIPHGDTDYNTTNRPTLYIAPNEAIDLNGFASFHPSLQDLMPAYTANELAVIHRIGYPDSSRSHFDGQRIWENGDPSQAQLFEGWLYRYIKSNALDAGVDLPVVTTQATPPLVTSGEAESFLNIASPTSFAYVAGEPIQTKLKNAWKGAYEGLFGLEAYRPVLSQTGVRLVDSLDEYASWDQANWDPKDPDDGYSLFPVDATTDPENRFSPAAWAWFASLKISVLALLESDGTGTNGTRIAGTQLGGWDHHDQQGTFNGQHPELLRQLAAGLRSVRIVLSGAANDPRNYPAIWDDTIVATMSEFGRTTVENGNLGTDHASASVQLVMGGSIQGGVYNCDSQSWPNGVMFGVDGRYLLYETDYRSVFWEILRDHMGANAGSLETIFPGYGAAGLGAGELGLVT